MKSTWRCITGEECKLKSSQSWVNTVKIVPLLPTLQPSENKLSRQSSLWTESQYWRGVHCLLPSLFQLEGRSPVFLKPLLAAFPLLHFPSSHLVPHTNSALRIIIISCVLSLAFLLFSMFP